MFATANPLPERETQIHSGILIPTKFSRPLRFFFISVAPKPCAVDPLLRSRTVFIIDSFRDASDPPPHFIVYHNPLVEVNILRGNNAGVVFITVSGFIPTSTKTVTLFFFAV